MSIGPYVFKDRSDLCKLKIPRGIIEIDDGAFLNCSSLTRIELPSTLKRIGARSFENCRSLTSLEIPGNVVEIGDHAFYKCPNIKIMVINAINPPVVKGRLGCSPKNGARVPSQSTEAYKRANGWSAIEIPYAYIP